MKQAIAYKEHPKSRKKLGHCLIEAGLISKKDLANALEIQKVQKKKIGQILIEMGTANDEQICQALSDQLNISLIRLDEIEISKEIIAMVPSELAENYSLIPIKITEKSLLVAMANPLDLYALDDLRFVTQMPIEIAVSSQRDILKAIERYYPNGNLETDIDSRLFSNDGLEIIKQEEIEANDPENLKSLSQLPPIVRLINSIIIDAIKIKASDIHIEPQKGWVVIRYRVDGILREIMKTNRFIHASLVSRIKVMSNMDISIRRKPQDGRSQVRYRNKSYDLRISTIPLIYGEKVTIRILDQETGGIRLEDLGLSEIGLGQFADVLAKPQGIVLVTGPTGSGKSSTLYACLNSLNSPEVNVITVEDPVEFDIAGINQVQIHPQAGITFSSGLRSILRQDPDIVMVGEIRDSETASIAFQAGQTGHLVLSTLHTNDAPSAVIRLLDLGIPAFLISTSLITVVGQRLVRRVCPKCKAFDPLTPQIMRQIPMYLEGARESTFWKGIGCEACQYTGYSGRLGIFEVLMLTPSLKEIIEPDVTTLTLRKAAESEGFQSMATDGIKKAMLGLTTIEEVYRVAPPEFRESSQRQLMEAFDFEDTPTETHQPQMPLASVTGITHKKILVVDDDELTLRLLRNSLESENYLVVTARSGAEAMKVIFQEKPDLIITDYVTQETDGIKLIKKLRSQLSTRFLPIIILTVKDNLNHEVKGIAAGADDYIRKPINLRSVLIRVNRLLDRQPDKKMQGICGNQ